MKLNELQTMRAGVLASALNAMDRFSYLDKTKEMLEAEKAKLEARHQFDVLAGIDEQIIRASNDSQH